MTVYEIMSIFLGILTLMCTFGGLILAFFNYLLERIERVEKDARDK